MDMPKPAVSPPEVAALIAERYGFPIVGGAQARLIASLHALINWILEHPDIPMAHYVELRAHPAVTEQKVTAVDLVDLAARLDGRVDSLGSNQWMIVPVCGIGPDSARVEYVVFAGQPNNIGPL